MLHSAHHVNAHVIAEAHLTSQDTHVQLFFCGLGGSIWHREVWGVVKRVVQNNRVIYSATTAHKLKVIATSDPPKTQKKAFRGTLLATDGLSHLMSW